MFPRLKVHHHLLGVLRLLRIWFLIGHWDVLQNLLDVRLEAHVDHTIGLIQDHIRAAAQDQVPVVKHVDQTTRGGDHDLLESQHTPLVNDSWSFKMVFACADDD